MMAPIFIKSKEEALPDIKNWLVSAFREKKGYFVPKKEVFGAYADFCAANHYESTTPASFGKFLKKIFPGVETRRLIRNNEQAMYYYNLTPTAAPASSRRWTSVQSSSSSSTAPTPSTALSSSTPAPSIYASSSSSSSPQAARRRRTSSLESQQPTEPRFHLPQSQRPHDHHHAQQKQQQQRLCRSASPSHAMFGEFANAAAHGRHHHHAPLSTLPTPPTFQSPSPSLSSSWSAEARGIRSPSPTRLRRGDDEEQVDDHEGHRLRSSGGSPHHIDDLVVASMRRINEERKLPSHSEAPFQSQAQYQQQRPQPQPQPQPWQYQYQHHPYYQLMSTMSAQRPSDLSAASFAAAALQLPGVAFASSSSTTYDASAWAGVDYLHPLMTALPHSAMALAAAAAAASHHQHLQELQQSHHQRHQQQQLESRPSSLSAASPPMVFTTATSTTTTAAAAAVPSPIFARHALTPAATALKRERHTDRAAASAKRRRGEEYGGCQDEGGKHSDDDGDIDKPQPTIKDEPHDYHDSYAAAASSSSPTSNDCSSAGGRKKKSRLDFILN